MADDDPRRVPDESTGSRPAGGGSPGHDDPPQVPDKSPGSGSGFLTGEKVDEEDRTGIVGKTNDEDTAYDHDDVDDAEGVKRSGA